MRLMSKRFSGAVLALALLSGCAHHAPNSPPANQDQSSLSLAAPQHGDFGHYTLALTWQPGFCSGPKGNSCNADQPREPLVGLHGLWASRPSDLIKTNVPVTTWWQKGCALYTPGATLPAPHLSAPLTQRLAELVAHTHSNLVDHEYKKHVQCFGMDGEQFFTAAATLRDRFASLPAARYLESSAGQVITKTDLSQRIQADTGALPDRGVQFQCNKDAQNRTILSQIWFTLKPDHLSSFSRAEAFLSSPQLQDNCPARFLVPEWQKPATP
ncbi:hypothetical protein ACI01nite_24620 [Acetobacter cibinongensis]|uniref:Ribonuclease I n=1 Tax=Acetobacter cibinongensis TaxID=146475 RepID=A0A0D6N7X2_9PROT|nr:ribonuclease I [Acetobacter cibinongensis]GAN61668.1 ribonuclease I [Acetobacter cibinongensis]GEL59860.1 hypothetical protein ACI01nite_24620 [Acetobacter cibinongensis]